jgi:type VI secretion system secreted protein Hcp
MAFDAYLKLDGIDGEATRKGYEKQINVLSFSFGASNPSSPIGKGAGAGKVSISDISIMKWTDKSSAQMFQACCAGKHFPKAELTVMKSGGDQAVDYLKYEFTKVMVTSIQWSGATGGDDVPTESVSFAFGTVKVTYTEQKPDGTKGGAQIGGWDLEKSTALGK